MFSYQSSEAISLHFVIALEYVSKAQIYNNVPFVEVIPWQRRGRVPVIKPMMTQFTDASMYYYAPITLLLPRPKYAGMARFIIRAQPRFIAAPSY